MKLIIWSSEYLFDAKAREEYKNSQRNILDDEDYNVSDTEWQRSSTTICRTSA